MMDRQNKPRPRIRFSPKSSGTMSLMFPTLTLLIRPLILFLRASQAILWNSFDLGSLMFSCKALSFAGGTYTPPLLFVSSSLNSFFASSVFSSAVNCFLGRASCCCAREDALLRLDSFRRPLWRGMSRSNERRRGGDRMRRGGDRESGERFLFPVDRVSAGSGVGRRTAEAMTSAMLWEAVG